MIRTTLLLIALCLFGFALSGCGGHRPDNMPKLHPMTLAFTQDGAPLVGASISLIPQSPDQKRWAAGGITDAAGNVTPVTLGQYSGVVAGKFKVTVEKTETDAPITTEGEMTKEQREADARRKTYDLVDLKFGGITSTDLEIEVGSGTTTKTFDVGKAVRIARP